MSRSLTYTALVLRVRPSGESNREAWFLTAEEGVLRTTVFGGPKSRLRAHVAPFHRGRLWIYYDPVRDSRKVTDFDVEAWRPGIRERYERTMAADAVAETILASQGGGGGWDHAFSLGDRTLSALEGAAESCCLRVLLRFLWNWADFLGLRPEFRCASCGRDFTEAAAVSAAGPAGALPAGVLWYSPYEGDFLCSACRGVGREGVGPEGEGFLPLGPAARRWLSAGERAGECAAEYAGERPGFPPAPVPLEELRTALTGMMTRILGRRLGTWDMV
jgi:DNA repair protein RecO (recombination protein O)